MAEGDINNLTMEQYLALTQGNQTPGVVTPEIRGNVNFKIKSQFMRELREDTFSDNKNDDPHEHVEQILDIVSFFNIPRVTHDAVMLRVFPSHSWEPLKGRWTNYPWKLLIPGISLKRPLSKGTVHHPRPLSSLKKSVTSSRKEMKHCTKLGKGTMTCFINAQLMTSIAIRRNTDSNSNSEGIVAIWSKRRLFELAGLMASVLRAYLHAYDPLFSMEIRYLISIHKGFCFHQGISLPITNLTERLLLEERDLPATPQEGLFEAPPFDEFIYHAPSFIFLASVNALLDASIYNESARMKAQGQDDLRFEGLTKDISFPDNEKQETDKSENDEALATIDITSNIKQNFNNALADFGASINVMPFSMYKHLGMGKLELINMVIKMADNTKCTPKGIVENLLVKIKKFIFLVDFVILDMVEDFRMLVVLGRPLLATAHAKVDIFRKSISLEVGNEKVIFKMKSSFTTTIFESVRAIRCKISTRDNNLMNIDYDLFLYESESCEFNHLLAVDPDIFTYDIDVQESYEEVVYWMAKQRDPWKIKEMDEANMEQHLDLKPIRKPKVHWCKAGSQEKESGHEYWASCDLYSDICDGEDSLDDKKKRYWEIKNDLSEMTRERILKDHWRERFGDEDDDTEENLEDPEKCGEDKANAIC
ncbi:zinc knuckle CX2CX4HX4C containing protein [Tanacetum coccineum]